MHSVPSEKKEPCHFIIIFGIGLIGSAIFYSLRSLRNFKYKIVPLYWSTFNKEDESFIVNEFKTIAEQLLRKINSEVIVSWVWSAGKAGFGAQENDVSYELSNFLYTLEASLRSEKYISDLNHHFHLVSSAGGLFEGQRNVGPASSPKPLRPYGHLKLEQEKALQSEAKDLKISIYRPSTVYGFYREGQRMGLVSTLIANGIARKVSTFYGNEGTIRDYIFSSDIGTFISKEILETSQKKDISIYTLASAKPTSLFEIKKKVESKIDRRLYATYVGGDLNSLDNSYEQSILPDKLTITDLNYGIYSTYQAMLNNYLLSSV
jgi:UDP-glucose 4-epimerase